MAYTRALNAATQFGDPLVLSVFINYTSAETNVPVKVPWNGVNLVYASQVVTAVPTSTDVALLLEIDAADGTTIGSATVTESGSAVGDVDEFTMASTTDRTNLMNTNIINISIDGGANAGSGMVYMYFEPSPYDS